MVRPGGPQRGLRLAWYLARATLRRRGPGLLWLTIVIALLGGLAMGSLAGARRTASSFDVFWAASNPSDLAGVTGVLDPLIGSTAGFDARTIARIGHLPHVAKAESAAGFDLLPLEANGVTPLHAPDFYTPSAGNGLGSVDGLWFDQDRVTVVQGRLANPHRADEFVMTAAGARSLGAHVGERVPFGIYTNAQTGQPGFGTSRVRPIRVLRALLTGIVVFDNAVVQDDADIQGSSNNLFTPALTTQLLRCCVNYTETAIRVTGGSRFVATVANEVDGLLPKGFPPFSSLAPNVAKADRSIRPFGLALGVFGGIVALAALLISGLLLARQVAASNAERAVLRALGAGPGATTASGLLAIGVAILAGVLGSLAVAVALSPLAPIGPVRPVYPSRGLHADWSVLGPGAAILVVALAAVALALGWRAAPHRSALRRASGRASSLVSAAAAAGLPPTAVAGLRMSVGGRDGGRAGAPVRSAGAGMVLAMAALVCTATFAASLTALVSTPGYYGWNWNYALVAGADLPQHQAAVLLDHDRYVAAWSGAYTGTARLDGIVVPVLGTSPRAAVAPSILSGHGLDAADQVVLGPVTMAQLHMRLGQTVTATNALGQSRSLRIVGTAALPALISSTGGAHLELGLGAVVAYTLIPAVDRNPFDNPVPGPNLVFVRLRHGVDHAAALRSLQRIAAATSNVFNFGVQVVGVLRPAEIVNFRTLGSFPASLAAAVGGGALLALALTLLASVRRRRRELALFKVLGFTRREVAATVAWHATATVLAAVILGLPLGVAAGRWLWELFARNINVVPAPAVPASWLVAIALGALALANVVAAVPGLLAARTSPALALRAE